MLGKPKNNKLSGGYICLGYTGEVLAMEAGALCSGEQFDGQNGPFIYLALYFNYASVPLNDPMGDRQT